MDGWIGEEMEERVNGGREGGSRGRESWIQRGKE